MASTFFFQANQFLKQHCASSFATKSERIKTIRLVDKQLRELGFKNLQLKGLKPKHIDALLQKWQAENLSAGTIKNRMVHIRWLTEKIGKKGVISPSNSDLGIDKRVYVTNENKGKTLTEAQLNAVSDPYIKMSLQLQAAFGLRREEAMKMIVDKAVQGDRLLLDASWCKGGRDRAIPILTDEQRQLLAQASTLTRGGSLIPPQLMYVQQMKRYENTCLKIGLDRAHGLRHRYAQQRYVALTGFECHAVSGVAARRLSEAHRALDKMARAIITQELGHGRLPVTAVYLGS